MRQWILSEFAYGLGRLHSSFVVCLEWPVVTLPVEERQPSVYGLCAFADYGAFVSLPHVSFVVADAVGGKFAARKLASSINNLFQFSVGTTA
jgi:hypothetical protein